MYDIIIIGGGPAGLTAGIYAKEANKSVLLLEKMGAGGQVNGIFNVTNYPGFKNIDGFELGQKMREQALGLGLEIKAEEVTGASLEGEVKTVKTHKNSYEAKSIIIATGAYARPLDVPNEKEFYGKGLSYCATCDGGFFKDKTVAVVGGGNTSIDDCLYLLNLVKKLYLIHRRDTFTATERDFNRAKALGQEKNVMEIKTNCVVTNLIGNEKLEAIEVENKVSGETEVLDVDGIFIAIGRKPDSEIFKGQLNLTSGGFIETNEFMETNVKGVYAVGDVRNTPLRQIITACSDGAIAVNSIIKRG